jgi:hypothetical protein
MKKSLFAVVTLCATVALAQSAVRPVTTPVTLPSAQTTLGQSAQINWTAGTLTVKGIGTASKDNSIAAGEVKSLAAARADAQRLLVSALRSVRVTSTTTVRDFELRSDEIKLEIEGSLQYALPVRGSEKVEQKSDGSFLARIEYVVALYGYDGIADVLQNGIAASNANKPKPTPPNVAASPAPAPLGSSTRPAAGTLPYTGLVVDARGMNYAPCMSPKIWMSNNREVWGTLYSSSDFVNSVGIAAFVQSIEDAQKLPARGAPGQLVIKAVRTTDAGRCDVLVSDSDARLIFDANAKNGFLAEYKVTFLY